MKKLIIVGAGSFAREVLLMIEMINACHNEWEIVGMLDDNDNALDGIKCNTRIIGRLSDYAPYQDDNFALGISSPKVKSILVPKLKDRGFRFQTLIAPNVQVGDYVEIGYGCIITGISVGSNVKLGDFVSVMGSMIGQDSTIDDYSTTTGLSNIASATLGKRVFVGSHAVILNRVSVGDDSTVGAGSIVVRNVPSGQTVFGNPAKRLD